MSDRWIKEESYCNIGNFKLYEIFESRYREMYRELMPTDMVEKSQTDRHERTIVMQWHAYLKDMGMEISDSKSKECVMDPCSKMGARYWFQYINVPEELALKILTLGYLP